MIPHPPPNSLSAVDSVREYTDGGLSPTPGVVEEWFLVKYCGSIPPVFLGDSSAAVGHFIVECIYSVVSHYLVRRDAMSVKRWDRQLWSVH